MTHPRVVSVAPSSPAAVAGLQAGDEVARVNGVEPRDVLAWHQLVEGDHVELQVLRGGTDHHIEVSKRAGQALGAEVDSPVFDRVRTCDNHCEFCFIFQLPKGLRRSLYVKDDDYRLSFLYGNFTTLTRFTEADLERVVTERLSPLHVSIHATDPEVRARMLRNQRGATSLRWLRALLDQGIEVHGQVVVCPGVNDGEILHDTFAGILDEYPDLASVGVVPLGVSRHTTEAAMREHTRAEAEAVMDAVEGWQDTYLEVLGRRLVFAADEYHLMAGRPFPGPGTYEGFPQHENGIGMATSLMEEFAGRDIPTDPDHGGFFASVDGAPATGYRQPGVGSISLGRDPRPVAVLTGALGAQVIEPLLARHPGRNVRLVPVANEFFGGNIGVTGLMVGEDLRRVLADEPAGQRHVLPDVCLSGDRFLDGSALSDLPVPVEVVPTTGAALRQLVATAPSR